MTATTPPSAVTEPDGNALPEAAIALTETSAPAPEPTAPTHTQASQTVSDNVHNQRWQSYLKDCKELIHLVEPLEVAGRIVKVTGLVMVWNFGLRRLLVFFR